jgi:hypothetical protein
MKRQKCYLLAFTSIILAFVNNNQAQNNAREATAQMEKPHISQGQRYSSPRLWTASNGEINTPGIEVTPNALTVSSVTISKRTATSILKVGFSGGNLSFFCDPANINLTAQVVVAVWVDGQVVAESLNSDSGVAFRNQCPAISTLIKNLKAGRHTISVCISKSSNPGEGGSVTYLTNIGHIPNTYTANLTVEEWASE